ncbi:MAG: Rid family detoxifying hydrolase [Clostridia bacterium]|nr:Rid family detoxifying hydrolase [Clostridia bacterium]
MKKVETKKAPAAAGPYSQAVIAAGMVYVSGQLPINPESGLVEKTDITGQTVQVMENISEILEAAGSSLDKAVKTTCFLGDMKDFGAFNEVYAKYFSSKPARSCVEAKIPKGALLEVDVIALCGN